MNSLQKLDDRLRKEILEQTLSIYGAAGIVLWEHGWRERKIKALYDLTESIWHECGMHGTKKSMLEMLEEETGVEMRLEENGRSYHEIDYLNGKLQKYRLDRMTKAQFMFMRQGQIRWVKALVQACLFLALHRKYGYGATRMQRLLDEIFKVQDDNGNDYKKIAAQCGELINLNLKVRFGIAA